jgi:hypothetical protein
MIEKLFGSGRKGGVLLIAGAMLGAVVVGPGATIAQKAMNLNTTTGDKRYVKRGEIPAAGSAVETPLKITGTTFTTIASTKVKAPGAGFLVVHGSLSAKDDGPQADDRLNYRLSVGTTPLTTTPQAFELYLGNFATTGRQNGSVDGFVKVARKGTLDVKLEAANGAANHASEVLGRSVTAQFIPKAKAAPAKKKPAGGNVGP